jgi:DNA-binding response OmpR family regulator
MRILFIEDDIVLAQFVKLSVKPQGIAVDHFGNGDEGLEALAVTAYDLVVLDLTLPDMDGLALLRNIRQARNSTPVLILSARDAVDQRVAGLDAGADDYLAKPFEITELCARIRALSRRPRAALDTSLACGNLVYSPAEHGATVDGQPLALPRREAMVLEVLIRNAGRPVSKSLLEDRLYAYGEEIASNSVEVHIHHLRKRLKNVRATLEIQTKRGTGYVLTGS